MGVCEWERFKELMLSAQNVSTALKQNTKVAAYKSGAEAAWAGTQRCVVRMLCAQHVSAVLQQVAKIIIGDCIILVKAQRSAELAFCTFQVTTVHQQNTKISTC